MMNRNRWKNGDAYTLPSDWEWCDIQTERERWGMMARRVPLATAGGAVAWGTFLPCDVRR